MDRLYSNRSAAMLTIADDTVGRHDFLHTPCSPEIFKLLYGQRAYHPGGFETLAMALAPFGIGPDNTPTTFNMFMNVEVLASGELKIASPGSRPGGAIAFRAEMDLIVGLTACSATMSTNYCCMAIEHEVIRRDKDV
jgi:uncharacterized protein YcgI (DUF1989 family)